MQYMTTDPLPQIPLGGEESIVWMGKPDLKVYTKAGAPWFTVSFTWGTFIFGCVWTILVFISGAPIDSMIWGGAISLFGCYLVFGRPYYAKRECEGLLYILTNKRAIVYGGTSAEKIQSIDLTKVANIKLLLRNGKSGDIVFHVEGNYGYFLPGLPWTRQYYNLPVAFYGVPNAAEVYNDILKPLQLNKVS